MKTAGSKIVSPSVRKLDVHYRIAEGTKKCRDLRSDRGKIPGVVYGRSLGDKKILMHVDKVSLAEIIRARGSSFASTLVDLTVRNEYDSSWQPVEELRCLPRNLTVDSLMEEEIISCNWMVHDPQRGARVFLPVVLKDYEKCPGIKRGAKVNRQFWFLPCLCKGPVLPDTIEVSLEGMQVGDKKRWSDVKFDLPDGCSVENLMFRKETLKKSNTTDITLVSLEGARGSKKSQTQADESEDNDEDDLDSF